MAFITDDDITVQIRSEIKTALMAGEPGSWDLALLFAQKEMESYLVNRSGSNVSQIFAATGAERNPLIIMYLIDIALYHLHSKTPGRVMPEIRMDRYDAAITWLKMVAKGDLNPVLPAPPETTKSTIFRGSSNQQYSKNW